MIRKVFKWLLIVVGILLVIVLIASTVVYFKTESRINKTYSVNLQPLMVPADSAAYELGKHTAQNRGCLGCHGADLAGGRNFLEAGSPVGSIYAVNITSGKGGIQYTDADWIRALRHGLSKENKSLWFMPSHELYHISNREMGSLIHFLKQQAPVDKENQKSEIKPLGRMLVFMNEFPLLTAEMVDHNAQPVEEYKPEVTAAYGRYLATTCEGCHLKTLKGAPAHTKVEPNIPDISATGNIGKWTAEDFITVMHSGKTPEGKQLTDYMPYKYFTYTDDELKAIFLYMQSVK
jgi:mono/diheme cytochrome c family protein